MTEVDLLITESTNFTRFLELTTYRVCGSPSLTSIVQFQISLVLWLTRATVSLTTVNVGRETGSWSSVWLPGT